MMTRAGGGVDGDANFSATGRAFGWGAGRVAGGMEGAEGVEWRIFDWGSSVGIGFEVDCPSPSNSRISANCVMMKSGSPCDWFHALMNWKRNRRRGNAATCSSVPFLRSFRNRV
jgi:hypothetical protein